MYDGSQGNAMTEVALALAMGFFSMLVLTLVSMGGGKADGRAALTAVLAPPAAHQQAARPEQPAADDFVLIYHQGRFLTAQLEPIDPKTIETTKRVVLAFPPKLSMAEALAARAEVQAERLVVSTLDDRWLAALARPEAAGGSGL